MDFRDKFNKYNEKLRQLGSGAGLKRPRVMVYLDGKEPTTIGSNVGNGKCKEQPFSAFDAYEGLLLAMENGDKKSIDLMMSCGYHILRLTKDNGKSVLYRYLEKIIQKSQQGNAYVINREYQYVLDWYNKNIEYISDGENSNLYLDNNVHQGLLTNGQLHIILKLLRNSEFYIPIAEGKGHRGDEGIANEIMKKRLNGENPPILFLAVDINSLDLIRALKYYGADIAETNKLDQNRTALQYAIAQGRSEKIIKELGSQ
jgi:hypothetical protein